MFVNPFIYGKKVRKYIFTRVFFTTFGYTVSWKYSHKRLKGRNWLLQMACPSNNTEYSLYEFFCEEVGVLPEHVQPLTHLCNAVHIYSKCELVCPIQTRPNGCGSSCMEKRRNFYKMLNVLKWAREQKYMVRIQFEIIITHLWADEFFQSKMKSATKDELGLIFNDKWDALNLLLLWSVRKKVRKYIWTKVFSLLFFIEFELIRKGQKN